MNARMTGIWAGTAWLVCAAAFATDADYVEAAAFTQTSGLLAIVAKTTLSGGCGAGVSMSRAPGSTGIE